MVSLRLPLTISLFLGLIGAAHAADQLTPDEIKAKFGDGTPFTATSLSGKGNQMTLSPDGTAKVMPKGSTTPQMGTWRVSDKGYCSKWGTAAEKCFIVVKSGKWFRVESEQKKLVSHWSKP